MNGLNVDPALMTRLQQSLNQQPAQQGAIGQAQVQMPPGPIIPKQPVPAPQPMAPAISPPQPAESGLTPQQQEILTKVSALPPASQQKFKEAIMQAAQAQGQGAR